MKKEQYKKEQEEKARKEEEAKLAAIKAKEDEEKRIEDEKKKKQDDQRKAIKDLRTTFAEKVESNEYDKFWLQSFMEKMKVDDMIAMKEALDPTTKQTSLKVLKEFIEKFNKTLEDRKKQNAKDDKERQKVTLASHILTQ